MTIVFLMIVNYLHSNDEPWFIYPAFALLLFPISLFLIHKKQYTLHSIIVSILMLMFLSIINYMYTPTIPWVLYAIAPLVIWPVVMISGKKAGTFPVALGGSIGIIVYYVLLNLVLSPYFPWAIFTTFAILWWPLAVYHVKKRTYFQFSVHGSVLIGVFFISLNAIASPQHVWAVYPIFAVLWWPLSMYYFGHKKNNGSVQ